MTVVSDELIEKAKSRGKWLASLDPGIAPYVDVLDAAGVETFESCQAGPGHCFAEPTVRFYGERGAGFHALSVALTHRLPVAGLRRYWYINDGEPCGPYWELTFRSAATPSPPKSEGIRPEREALLATIYDGCDCDECLDAYAAARAKLEQGQ